MGSITVTLAINTQEFARLYRGQARDVICTSKDGRTVQFPANALRQFLTHDGIYGEFEIFFTKDNKLAKVEKLK
ncbi:MAG: DUF2835 domain-containing protein [Gammaproteobacteria bacterium]|nr:DUF2835 domain-containing protein [Gammaproteobacteria bacterium]